MKSKPISVSFDRQRKCFVLTFVISSRWWSWSCFRPRWPCWWRRPWTNVI